MVINFGTAKESLAPYIANGVCPTDDRVAPTINEAIARLIDSGKWVGLIKKISLCHRAGLMTLPRDVETVLEASVCDVPITVRNQWFEFLPGGPFRMSQCNPWPALAERGDNYCTAFDITGVKKIRVYNDLSVDDGKFILLQGTNGDGNRVQTQNSGEWVDGEILTLNNATPPVTDVSWTKLECIQKTLTTGFLRIYQVNPDTMENVGLLVELHPNDTIPSFRRYFYGGFCRSLCDEDNNEQRYQPFTFLVKTRFNSLVQDSDIVPITASGALKNMCMAIWQERNNQLNLAQAYESRSIAILQNELKQSQGSQVSMKVSIPGFGNGPAARSFR